LVVQQLDFVGDPHLGDGSASSRAAFRLATSAETVFFRLFKDSVR
jgi:hypothetical protein